MEENETNSGRSKYSGQFNYNYAQSSAKSQFNPLKIPPASLSKEARAIKELEEKFQVSSASAKLSFDTPGVLTFHVNKESQALAAYGFFAGNRGDEGIKLFLNTITTAGLMACCLIALGILTSYPAKHNAQRTYWIFGDKYTALDSILFDGILGETKLDAKESRG